MPRLCYCYTDAIVFELGTKKFDQWFDWPSLDRQPGEQIPGVHTILTWPSSHTKEF